MRLKRISLLFLFLASMAFGQTTLESHVARRCEVKYTGNPHTLFLYTDQQLAWLTKSSNLRFIRKVFTGSVVIFKGLWLHGEDTHAGVYTENGIYVWRNPRQMREYIKYLHDLGGLKIYLYNSPHVWVEEGYTGRQFLAEAMRLRQLHGDIHFYFDGYGWESQIATEATLRGLRDRGFSFWIHGSIAPNLGSTQAGREAEVRMPGAELADSFLWGEVNVPHGDFGPWYKSLVAYIDHPDVLCLYKPFRDTLLKGNYPLAAIFAERHLVIDRFSPSTNDLKRFNLYFQIYRESRKRYEADPEEFVRQKMMVMGR